MRTLLVVAALVTTPVLGAAPKLLQPGDVALISTLAIAQCFITPPTPIFGVSVIPEGGTVSSFSYDYTWGSYTNPGAIAYSDQAGMIVSSDQTGAGNSILSVLHDDGSTHTLGTGVPVPGSDILGIAPTSTDIVVLASVPLTGGQRQGELWRLSASGDLLARIPLSFSLPPPPPVTSHDNDVAPAEASIDVAADQCTVLYTRGSAIGRYDACRQVLLSDFAKTDALPLGNVRIGLDGVVFALAMDGRSNQVVRFSPDGQLLGSFSFSLILEEKEYVSAFAFDQTGKSLWVATSFRCVGTSGRLMLIDRTTGRVLSTIQPETALPKNWFVALATVSEWRAALPRPTSRRHAAGH